MVHSPSIAVGMCLLKRKVPKEVASTQIETPPMKPNPKKSPPNDSSLELDTSYTMSHSFTQGSKNSRSSQTSTGTEKSLAGLKGMLSDGAQFFTYRDLMKATDNFGPARKLGASTFRGLVAGKDVVVVVEKRQNLDVDFVAEVKSICNLHHSNLVKVVGGCMSGDQLYLVYEYIPGANLRQCLRSPMTPGYTTLKSWVLRLQVALHIAKGLEYLHEHASPPVVHKYLKSSSILVDNELHARIANVGIARVRGEKATEAQNTLSGSLRFSDLNHLRLVESPRQQNGEYLGRSLGRSVGRSRSIKITGTHGYMAPEYSTSGLITSKLDVFSFGVILLEILSGQEAVRLQQNLEDNSVKKTFLPDVIATMFLDKDPRFRIRSWIDPLLRDAFPLDCACRTAHLAKKCVSPNPDDRPFMHNVVLTLEQIFLASLEWEENMIASKDFLTSSVTAR